MQNLPARHSGPACQVSLQGRRLCLPAGLLLLLLTAAAAATAFFFLCFLCFALFVLLG